MASKGCSHKKAFAAHKKLAMDWKSYIGLGLMNRVKCMSRISYMQCVTM